MIQSRSTTRFGGSSTLHFVATAPRRPSMSKVQLSSNEVAAVLAFIDGLTLVCTAQFAGETADQDVRAQAGAPCQATARRPT